MTNADKIRAMPSDEMAKYICCPSNFDCTRQCIYTSCTTCVKEWLDTVVDEPKEEPQKPKVPSLIDKQNFEQQLESFSIKAFVHQVKYLASIINEIIKYLEEVKGEN